MPRSNSSFARALVLTLAVLAAACTDRAQPLAPLEPPAGSAAAHLECRVSVQEATMECARVEPASGGYNANRIVGGQELYVMLASSGTAYDGGAQELRSNVTVQNLMQHTIGTLDGVTVDGLKVFFTSEPIVTSGTGTVSVANADGYDTFTGAGQPYFHYHEMLSPYQMSGSRQWVFDVPATVNTFAFNVYVDVSMEDPQAPMLGALWTGDVGDDWFTAGNWQNAVVPDSASVVSILADTLISGPGRPVLSAGTAVGALRVGSGTTLDLTGNTLTVWGNVDVPGQVTGGTIHMGAATSLLRGNVPALRITAGVALQGATRTTGAVSVSDGSLTITDRALSISVP
jgi:hypothetical protein